MPTDVIMPALELAQETGKVLRWLKAPGESVRKGEPLVEIETDKVTVELEAPAAGVLGELSAREGDVVPVGRTIARILDAGEAAAPAAAAPPSAAAAPAERPAAVRASPLARRLAEQHGVDLAALRPAGGRIEKADVLAYVEARAAAAPPAAARLVAASPRARRLAAERGLELGALRGSGPGGAVLAADLPATAPPAAPVSAADGSPGLGTIWRRMAERMTASWTSAPHFYLVREVDAGRLAAWRSTAAAPAGASLTYTDLLVRLSAAALVRHPGVNAAWRDGTIQRQAEVHIGLAVAVEDGLVVPVIHRADTLSLGEIAVRRAELVERAQAGRLRPADIQGGGFTISNLGMYGVDAFGAILNPPQAAILAVGRIADRVVAVEGRPAVRPTLVLTLTCDHRALDGARAARFLETLAGLIEEPLALLA